MNWIHKLLGTVSRKELEEVIEDIHKLWVRYAQHDVKLGMINDDDVKLISFMVKENTKNIDTLLTYLRKKTKK